MVCELVWTICVSEEVDMPIESFEPDGGLVTPLAVISRLLGLEEVDAGMTLLTVSVAIDPAMEQAIGVPESREFVSSVMTNPVLPLAAWQFEGHTVPSGAVRVIVLCPPTSCPWLLSVNVI